jgi:hypothetical protein
MPEAQTVRFVGTARPRVAPLGAAWADSDGDALAVQLPDDAGANEAAAHVPEAASLPSGTWVIVLPEPARGRGLLAAFGRKPIARATRCGALLLRGYVDIGAEVDPRSKMDLVYGRSP